MSIILGLIIVVATVYSILRKVDVRLALIASAIALGVVGGNLGSIAAKFLGTLSNEQFVLPICTAMGFAHVLRLTGCDQHLVHLLVKPLRQVRPLLIPGAVLVGFAVNIPVISQTSTAVAVGPVLMPILAAARVSPATAGASLLLGASLGGELLNPGAPELRTVSEALGTQSPSCIKYVWPLLLIQLTVAMGVFWLMAPRLERATGWINDKNAAGQSSPDPLAKINLSKSLVPLLPVTLLFLTAGPLYLLPVPMEWLVDPAAPNARQLFDGRLIGAAMLVGVLAAGAICYRSIPRLAGAFFEGAGYAFTHIISLIVAAACFGEGIKLIGFADLMGDLVADRIYLLLPLAAFVPLAFAWLSGSGMASTQSLFHFFVDPARLAGVEPLQIGAVVSIGAAAGRTMSPVAAVTLMCAGLAGVSPFDLARRVALPLLAGTLVMVIAAAVLP